MFKRKSLAKLGLSNRCSAVDETEGNWLKLMHASVISANLLSIVTCLGSRQDLRVTEYVADAPRFWKIKH